MRAEKMAGVFRVFVLSADDLRDWCDELSSVAPQISFSAECADGIKRDFESLEEICSYENARKKAIKSLTLWARTESYNDKVILTLDDSSTANIRFIIEGSEEMVHSVMESINKRLESMKPWYSWLAGTNFGYMVSLLLLCCLSGSLPAFIADVRNPRTEMRTMPWQIILPIVLLLSVGFASFFIRWIDRIQKNVYPSATFAIGLGKKRYEENKIFREVAIPGVSLTIICSFIWSLFW